jgi:hypothetical protein
MIVFVSALLAIVGISCAAFTSIWVLGQVEAPTSMYILYSCGLFCTSTSLMLKGADK